MRDYQRNRDDVQGSPHLFLADGYQVHDPGITMHREGEPGAGFPVADADDTGILADLVARAAATVG
ncbi:hypothetical protein [Micromonospora sp. KLBMP9576]|uniref:hypothetical protein n=1 Tax=Micromonospora sp. KLBMP9576 TaxID=3424769 RepID=UPI003D89CC53